MQAVFDPKTVLAAIGAAYVAVNAARFLTFLYGRTSRTVNLRKYKKLANKQDAWAIVTGASDGIGKQFAIELGKAGFNVVVMARTKSKLEAVAEECKKAGAKEVLVLPFDFSSASVKDYHEDLKETLTKKNKVLENCTLLINNVGVAGDYVQPSELEPAHLDARMIKLNCESQVQMTKLVLPFMKKNNLGGIVGLSSISSELQPPFLACYAATKSFNRSFSLALHHELRGTKIDSLAVKPGFVCTAMSGITKRSFQNVDAEPAVQYALSQLPHTKSLLGGAETSGHLNHNIMSGFFSWLPVFVRSKLVSDGMKPVAKKHAKRKAEAEKKAE